MSDTQSWSRAVATKFRSTRSGAGRVWASRIAFRTRRRRLTPQIPTLASTGQPASGSSEAHAPPAPPGSAAPRRFPGSRHGPPQSPLSGARPPVPARWRPGPAMRHTTPGDTQQARHRPHAHPGLVRLHQSVPPDVVSRANQAAAWPDRRFKDGERSLIRFQIPGGTVGDTRLMVTHSPVFAIGDQALVFLTGKSGRLPQVVAGEAGKRHIRVTEDGER